jgi:hypothetical protein
VCWSGPAIDGDEWAAPFLRSGVARQEAGGCAGGEPAGFSPKQEGIDVEMATIIWFVIAAIIVFWLLGMIGSIGGSLIHLLLVVALLLLIFNLVTGRRAV